MVHWSTENWCSFKSDVRTNNDCEGWHHKINRMANGKCNLNVYNDNVKMLFCFPLYATAKETELYEVLHLDGQNLRYKKTKYINMELRLNSYWNAYDTNTIDKMTFLKRVGKRRYEGL